MRIDGNYCQWRGYESDSSRASSPGINQELDINSARSRCRDMISNVTSSMASLESSMENKLAVDIDDEDDIKKRESLKSKVENLRSETDELTDEDPNIINNLGELEEYEEELQALYISIGETAGEVDDLPS